jgi:hypothetical protein
MTNKNPQNVHLDVFFFCNFHTFMTIMTTHHTFKDKKLFTQSKIFFLCVYVKKDNFKILKK